jgi:hypothetical protein
MEHISGWVICQDFAGVDGANPVLTLGENEWYAGFAGF